MIFQKKNKLNALKIYLTVLTLVLSSCAGIEPFPAKTLVEINIQKQICREYALIDQEKVIYKFIKEYSFEECPSVFGIRVEEVGQTTRWVRKAIQKGKECKNGGK